LRDRRGRHLAAARYFESLGDDELAGALAAHYLAAYRSAPDGPEAEALASQARIALRAAADRAIALGSPLQAVKYLEQAIEVTDSEEDRAAMLEQAGEAASNGARSDLALPLLEQAQEVRERLGDERAVARVIGLRSRALYAGRQHDESVALLRPAVGRFAAMSDDPVGITLTAALAGNLIRLNQYVEGLELLDRVLASAERVGAADIAAEAMLAKGIAYGYQGRMWEARALYGGARQLAEEISRPDLMASANQSLSFEVALDDPRLAVQLEREVIDLARQLGRRTLEITTLGNMSEDARRTGDWDWVSDEINAVMSLHPEGSDTIPLRLARQCLSAFRGEADGEEMANLARALELISDPDIIIGYQDIQASTAFSAGQWAEAAAIWLRAAAMSDLNQPYVLPRAGHAFVLAGDDAGAEGTLERLRALGTRGRAVDADRASIVAGIAALRGDSAGALAGYRTAMTAWRSLGLPWDEALTTLEAVTVLGTSDPEVAGWVDGARATFERLHATPLVQRLDEAVAATPSERASTAAKVESQV
jgi:tetratricopeptide (TPR) repeat protein